MAALPSDDLVWSIVKKHNSFVRKGLNGAVFSAEPYNLYNLHCKRFSGLANSKAVDVQPGEGNETRMQVKVQSKVRQPAKANHKTSIKRHNKRQRRAVARAARSVRPDLEDAAMRRASAVHKAIRTRRSKKLNA